MRATTCICNGFHGAAATCTLPLHIAVAWAHSCIYFFCAHNIETNIEAQLKIKTPTCQNKQAAVPLPNCAGNFPCTSQVGIPSHSCFQSWQGKQSRKGNDVSLQDSISTRAKGWMWLNRKLKAKVFSEHFCKCHHSAFPFYQGCQTCSKVTRSPMVLSSHYMLSTIRYIRLALYYIKKSN